MSAYYIVTRTKHRLNPVGGILGEAVSKTETLELVYQDEETATRVYNKLRGEAGVSVTLTRGPELLASEG